MSQGVSNQCWLAHPRVGKGVGSPGHEEKGVGPGIEITGMCFSGGSVGESQGKTAFIMF